MSEDSELNRLLHDIQSKCSSLKSAAKLLKDASPEEAREMVALMQPAAEAVSRAVEGLDKEFGRD